jgi:cellulose synthase/poly-beta-1,6-N-acetylglucosamine synthase-like glycosyltransferase
LRTRHTRAIRIRVDDDIDRVAREAVSGLSSREPIFSARRVLTIGQTLFVFAMVTAVFGLFALAPRAMAAVLVIGLALFNAAAFLFKGWLALAGARTRARERASPSEATLPSYSVLIPLYREASVVTPLLEAIKALDYPRDKLEVLLIVEEDDRETQDALSRHELSQQMRVVDVPAYGPRTKPKALSFALSYARGDLVAVFDAEDQPEPDQLKCAARRLLAEPGSVACLQARLNYFNARENWLTRLFAIDYCLWFDLLLPGLERLGAPVLLGGTSNHFRRDVLEAVGGWDPFNVTEDADLGLRIARKGFRVQTISPTTYEEAPPRLGAWLRQRTRWLKGYMQTWLVHMREPKRLWRETGTIGFTACQLFLLGTVLAGLFNPLLWVLSLLWLQGGEGFLSAEAGQTVLAFAPVSLILGNAVVIGLSMLAPLKRGWIDLVPWAVTVPVYWLLVSLAAWLALLELMIVPSYWAKTRHGITRFQASPRLSAAKKRPV